MIHCEESSISAVCRTRKRFDLSGAYPEHALYMGRKDKVHEIALQAGIPQPRSTYVSLSDGKTKEEILDLVTSAIPTFPLFRKPKMLMGLRGVGKVESEEELNRWITERMAEGDQETYIFQEFVSGTEFTISTVLLQDGSWVPLVIKHVAFGWSHHECISTGKPVVSIVEPFEEAQKENFPGMYDFARKVIETFKPPHPQVFCFQGFQRTPGKDDYVLNELAYRPAGERVNTLCYQACGVNQYTALILASIDPSYIPKPSHSSQRKLITGIWYPKREGTLLEHQEFPKRPNIKGTITGEWHVPIGTKMEKARNMGHMVATMFLESASKGERNEDIKWISENWTPVVKA
uniref:ATP-grasp domain-containing protein n=1 Tax=Steinernema glaseri TaxID=37863 RepID=A0A1I7YFS8_9BILA